MTTKKTFSMIKELAKDLLPGVETAGRRLKQGVRPPGKLQEPLPTPGAGPVLSYDPAAIAERYPKLGRYVKKWDAKKQDYYPSRAQSKEAQAVDVARQQAQAEIDAGNWTELYPSNERFAADVERYPPMRGDPYALQSGKPKIRAKWKDTFGAPESRARLQAAYLEGSKDPQAHNWYDVGQWEKAYIDQFGEAEGRERFGRDFADSMAATTGGMPPTDNFMLSQYLNWRRYQEGLPAPKTRDLPFPIRGRWLQSNLDAYDKMIYNKEGIDAGLNPKRGTFSYGFKGGKAPVIDEQMTLMMDPGRSTPGKNYGAAMEVLDEEAAKAGAPSGINFQDVAWLGGKKLKEREFWRARDAQYRAENPGTNWVPSDDRKKVTQAKSMMRIINEAIWRTHKVTGLPLAEVAARMRAGTIPTYGIGGAAIGAGVLGSQGPNRKEDST